MATDNEIYLYNELQRQKRRSFERTPAKWVACAEVQIAIDYLDSKYDRLKADMRVALVEHYRKSRFLGFLWLLHTDPDSRAHVAMSSQNPPLKFYSQWNCFVECRHISTSLSIALRECSVAGKCNVSQRDYYAVCEALREASK